MHGRIWGILNSTDNANKKTMILKGWRTEDELMAFLGGRRTAAQKNRTKYETEAYAIVKTFNSLDYHFWVAAETHIFAYHKNLF